MTGSDAFVILELEPGKYFVGPTAQNGWHWSNTDKAMQARQFARPNVEGAADLMRDAVEGGWPNARWVAVAVDYTLEACFGR